VKAALFVPCYVDQLYPQVALATVRVLERLGVEVVFPEEQTCCGQPMANAGFAADAGPLARRFLEVFGGFDAVVCPSGSCTSMVRNHYDPFLAGRPGFEELRRSTYELCEFVHDVLGLRALPGRYPRRVGLHQSCHGLRELRLGSSSERIEPRASKVATLLGGFEGLELAELQRTDECCGFGGTFAVAEEAVSCLMGRDRIADHLKAGAQVVTGTDVSCLMHMDGLARRARLPVSFRHVAEVLDEALAAADAGALARALASASAARPGGAPGAPRAAGRAG
jgi:L-lactate dehydrogenase complex protein LldE